MIMAMRLSTADEILPVVAGMRLEFGQSDRSREPDQTSAPHHDANKQ